MEQVLELDPVFAEVQARQNLSQSPLVDVDELGASAITSISSGSSGISASVVGGVATMVSPLTTKGDIFTRSTVGTRLAVGTEGEALFADPSPATGLDWKAAELIVPVVLDLNTNTKQTLYTVPAGKSAIITKIVARSPSGDITGGATTRLEFGFNAGADDWTSGSHFDVTASGLTASTLFKVFDQESAAALGSSTIGAAAQVFGAITDSAFGSAATVVIDVYVRLF